MLWTIFTILIILWLLGFSFHVGGGLIHALIVVAVIVLVWNLLTGRSAMRVRRPNKPNKGGQHGLTLVLFLSGVHWPSL